VRSIYRTAARTTPPRLGHPTALAISNPKRDVPLLRAAKKKGDAKSINRRPAIKDTTHLSLDVYGLLQLQLTIGAHYILIYTY